MPRATPMSAEERRSSILEATLPLLHEHGREVTTRQIAEAAGVAEGTIFRVFESKEELVLAAVDRGLDIEPFLADLSRIELDQDLRARLLDLVSLLQIRFRGIFTLMTAMGIVGPPRKHHHDHDLADNRRRSAKLMTAIVAPDADRITCTPEQLVHVLRMLTFSGTHPHISEGNRLTPEQIVSVVLDGVLKKGGT